MSEQTPGAHSAGDTLGGDTPPDGTDGSLGADAPAGDAGLSGGPEPGDGLETEDALNDAEAPDDDPARPAGADDEELRR